MVLIVRHLSHEGEELVYVLEGKLEFCLVNEKVVLEKGDFMYFDSAELHSGKSIGTKNAKLLVVMYSYQRL
jgi:quercetin dioxygenase-like cupin family protein